MLVFTLEVILTEKLKNKILVIDGFFESPKHFAYLEFKKMLMTLKKLGMGKNVRTNIIFRDDKQWEEKNGRYGDAQLPLVVYLVGNEIVFKFVGSFTAVSYLWKALDALGATGVRKVHKRRRKKREWEIF